MPCTPRRGEFRRRHFNAAKRVFGPALIEKGIAIGLPQYSEENFSRADGTNPLPGPSSQMVRPLKLYGCRMADDGEGPEMAATREEKQRGMSSRGVG